MTLKERPTRNHSESGGKVLIGDFSHDLNQRRVIMLELPEFLICALEARVAEANGELPIEERCTLSHYIESELVNIIALRDVAELECSFPGFAAAVSDWVTEMRA